MVVSSSTCVMLLVLTFMVLGLGSAVATGGFGSETKIDLNESPAGWNRVRHISDDTLRADPLDRLRKYRGGYDVTNKHYWSSAVFTGIHGYVIGLLWLISGAFLGGFLIVSSCINSHKKDDKALKKHVQSFKQCSMISIILAVFLTILVITAVVVVLCENAKFYSRANKVVRVIVETTDNASWTLYEATGALNSFSKVMETSKYIITDPSLIQSTSEELDSAAASILIQATKNRRMVNNILKISFITSTVIIALSLLAVIALSITGFLHFDKFIVKLIAICWILTFLCWILFGLYFFVDNFASDTCTALENFQQDPYNNTLSSLLPCKDMLPAKSAMSHVGRQIYSLVEQVNTNLLHMHSTSLPFAIQICDPFSGPPDYLYQPDDCPTGTIRIGNIPEVLKQLTCSDTNANNCKSVVSNSKLEMIRDYAISIQTLLNAFPEMESLVKCQTVKDAITEITSKHCTPLKRSVRILWTVMLLLSTTMVILILTWILKAYHNQNKHFTDVTVKPQNPTTINTLESGNSQNT